MIPVLLQSTTQTKRQLNTNTKSNKTLCALVLPKNKAQSLINKVVEKSTYTLSTQ
jgi:hypothetical protein